ncbi:MAG TPA: hypothetical protein VIR56_01625, partial [Solimonas sp.]
GDQPDAGERGLYGARPTPSAAVHYSGLPFCNDDPGRSSTRPFGRGDPAGSMPSPGRSGGASSRAIRYRRYGCGKGLGPELQGTSLRAAHGEAITPARHNLGSRADLQDRNADDSHDAADEHSDHQSRHEHENPR